MRLTKQLKQDLKEYLKERMHHPKSRAQIISACELSPDQIKSIKSRVEMVRDAEVDVVIDPEILAGVIVQYGSKRLDMSLRTRIETLFAQSHVT